ncbi:elongator complex protein 5 [Thalassophryne amazonica]|uniref:elongator complex protein 5 n=1 Tax=Thalassophryne amazonica TaxID=390379 RepID=UPI001471AD6A|nr:elongator complex protein 5 [Thalassophryne amazonica]
MLSELLQGTDGGVFVVIQDFVSYCGRQLLWSFINAALARDEHVHVLGFEISEKELKDSLKGSEVERLHFHNAYIDPLGWSDHPAFTVHQFTVSELTHLVKKTQQPKPPTLVIDSLSSILRHHSTSAVCDTLQRLKKGGAVRAIIGLLHVDMHQRGTVGSLCQLSTSVITVEPSLRGDEAAAKITKRSKSGKVMQDEEVFSIKEDLSVIVQTKPSQLAPRQAGLEEPQMDPTANLTFNLLLSDKEREAKERLTLPFAFSDEKKTALLHSGPGSGRILYEPDVSDDYDQEDPDDDLDV